MKKLLLACIFLTGCGTLHEPTLSSPPKDQAKYEQDLSECKDEARQRLRLASYKHQQSLTMDQKVAKEFMGFLGGAAGGYLAASSQTPDPQENPDYFKNMSQITDECMLNRGYPVVVGE